MSRFSILWHAHTQSIQRAVPDATPATKPDMSAKKRCCVSPFGLSKNVLKHSILLGSLSVPSRYATAYGDDRDRTVLLHKLMVCPLDHNHMVTFRELQPPSYVVFAITF